MQTLVSHSIKSVPGPRLQLVVLFLVELHSCMEEPLKVQGRCNRSLEALAELYLQELSRKASSDKRSSFP
jgi:hypothetical protein